MNVLLTLVAWTTAGACVAVSAVRFRHTGRRVLGSPREALAAVTSRCPPDRGTRAAADPAWKLVVAVRAARGDRARIAALNEGLLAIEGLTGDVVAVPRAAARIALFTGLGCAVLAVARTPSAPMSVAVALSSACAGLVGAVLCEYLGRLASRTAREVRCDYNRLATRLMTEACNR